MSKFTRLIVACVGFFAAAAWTPVVALIAMLVLALRYRAWEVILLGFFVDMLWLPPALVSPFPLFTVSGILLAWGLEPLRKEFLIR